MTTASATSLFEAGKATLDLARSSTLKLVDDIPADKFCHQPVPNTNHALWVLGHLACTDDWMACTVGKRESVIDESWNGLFGMKSTPTGDPGAYPPVEEVKAGLERARQSLLESFQSMDEQQLQGSPTEELKGFAPSNACMMHSLAWHEGLHAGQISAVRRSLGLPHALEA